MAKQFSIYDWKKKHSVKSTGDKLLIIEGMSTPIKCPKCQGSTHQIDDKDKTWVGFAGNPWRDIECDKCGNIFKWHVPTNDIKEGSEYKPVDISDVNMGKSISFNTNRQYSKNGQRIAAVPTNDGRIAFCDLDRGISGITNDKFECNEDVLMHVYDGGLYKDGDMTYNLMDALEKLASKAPTVDAYKLSEMFEGDKDTNPLHKGLNVVMK